MTRPRPSVVVLDYGSGNLRSAARALQRVGADARVSADPATASAAAGLVVPGVGAFAACMAGLRAIGGPQIIAKRLASAAPVLGVCVGMQVLFEAGDEHGRRTPGCGAWPGVVERLDAPVLPHIGWNTVCPPAGSWLLAGIDADDPFYFVHSYAVRSWPAPVLARRDTALPGAQSPGAQSPGDTPYPDGPYPDGPYPDGPDADGPDADGPDADGPYPDGPGPDSQEPPAEPLLTWAVHGERFVAAAEDGPLCATQFHPEKSGDAGAALLSNWLELLR